MAKNDILSGGYDRNRLEAIGQFEGSGSSGQIDAENTASEDFSGPMRKCITLNPGKQENFGVPRQILSLSRMLPPERRDLTKRLRFELEQVRMFQKKVESQRINGVTAASSSDIISNSKGAKKGLQETLKKSAVVISGLAKKGNPVDQARVWNRSSSGRFQSDKQIPPPSTANMILLKKCETILKQMMSHQYGWVFNKPVDVVELNIPDYLTIIKNPMDLGTVKKNITSGMYSSPLEFLSDVRLTFRNAMEYNPKGHDVHIMAETLSKFFEVRWKNIEKKVPLTHTPSVLEEPEHKDELEPAKMSPTKKRKINPSQTEKMPDQIRHRMSVEGRQNLARDLESLSGDMPIHIIDFLKKHLSNGRDGGEEEMEIDIDALNDDILFALRKLLDDYLLEKQMNQATGAPCEVEFLNESGPSNSSMLKGNDLPAEDIDIGGSDPPVSQYPSSEREKGVDHMINKRISSGSSSDLESDSSSEGETYAKAASPINRTEVSETLDSGVHLDDKTSDSDQLERNYSASCLDQLEQPSQQKPVAMEPDGHEDGDTAPTEGQVSPQKILRAAQVRKRFAATIMKAKEKTLSKVDKKDPETLRREKEEIELYNKKVKAKLEAEAKAAEVIQKQLEAAAAAEAREKREHERAAARQALLQIEKTVEINENSHFLEDLEMLRNASAEHLPSSVDETSPGPSSLDGLGGFRFGACSNPLEKLGLFMKDDEEEDCEPSLNASNPVNDMEEGEID